MKASSTATHLTSSGTEEVSTAKGLDVSCPGLDKSGWTQAVASRPCPLCGESGIAEIVSNRMQHRLDMRTVIYGRCTLVRTDPPPQRNLYERFYVDAYADYYGHIGASVPTTATARPSRRLEWQLKQIESFRPLRGCRLLEVGPGKGELLWWARQKGANAIGLEPSAAHAQGLRAVGLAVVEGHLEHCEPSKIGQFDVVVMFHVLEHFYDPAAALRTIQQLVADDGLIVIEVPNILKPFRSLDRFFLRYVHLLQYSPDTLRRMLAVHGFEAPFLDEGSDDWREPQSIVAIARRAARAAVLAADPDPRRVVESLRSYRRRWAVYGAVRWHVWRRFTGLRSFAIRSGRQLLRMAREPRNKATRG